MGGYMKITVEVSRKEFEELPDYLQDQLLRDEAKEFYDTNDEETMDSFIYDLREKYNYDMQDYSNIPEDIECLFNNRNNCLLLKYDKFEDMFLKTLKKRCEDVETSYIIDVGLNSQSFGIKHVDFPYIKVEGTPREAITVYLSSECPEDKKKNILNKADELYLEIYNSFLNTYKNFAENASSSYESAEKMLKDKYYYLDNKNTIMMFLNKSSFSNAQKADIEAKKELTEIYSKKNVKSELYL